MARVKAGTDRDKTISGADAINMAEIYSALMEDISLVYPRLKGSSSTKRLDPSSLKQNERRSLVRAIFALVEGMTFCLRVGLLEQHEHKLPHATVMALQELQLEIANDGLVRTKPMKSPLMSMLRLTVREYSAMYPDKLKSRCAGTNFEGLVKSVRFRDRLMHPRSIDDLSVADSEIKLAVMGMDWFQNTMAEMILVQAQYMQAQLKALEDKINILEVKKAGLRVELGLGINE